MKSSGKQCGGNHYKTMKIQPSHFIRANGIGFHEGNVIKYVCRHKNKNGRADIEKAIHYLELILEEDYQDKEGEWIPWHPGERTIYPGNMDNVVEMKFSSGEIVRGVARHFDWTNHPYCFNVAEYRVVESGDKNAIPSE